MTTKTYGVNPSLKERIDVLMPSVEYRRMVDLEDRQAVLDLRNEGYRRIASIPKDWKGDIPDDYDHSENSENFGIFVGGKLAAAMRLSLLCKDFPFGQSSDVFPDVVNERVQAGKRIIDPSRFVTDIDAAAQFPELPYIAMRLPVMACLHFDADECLTLIRKVHGAFYKRIFRAEQIAGPVYNEIFNVDIVLMASQSEGLHEDLDVRFPFWRSDYLERRQLFGPADKVFGLADLEKRAA